MSDAYQLGQEALAQGVLVAHLRVDGVHTDVATATLAEPAMLLGRHAGCHRGILQLERHSIECAVCGPLGLVNVYHCPGCGKRTLAP